MRLATYSARRIAFAPRYFVIAALAVYYKPHKYLLDVASRGIFLAREIEFHDIFFFRTLITSGFSTILMTPPPVLRHSLHDFFTGRFHGATGMLRSRSATRVDVTLMTMRDIFFASLSIWLHR